MMGLLIVSCLCWHSFTGSDNQCHSSRLWWRSLWGMWHKIVEFVVAFLTKIRFTLIHFCITFCAQPGSKLCIRRQLWDEGNCKYFSSHGLETAVHWGDILKALLRHLQKVARFGQNNFYLFLKISASITHLSKPPNSDVIKLFHYPLSVLISSYIGPRSTCLQTQ